MCINLSELVLDNPRRFKTEKPPWTEKKTQRSPKKKEGTHFCVGKNQKHLTDLTTKVFFISSLPKLSVL